MGESGGAAERIDWVRLFEQTRDTGTVCRRFGISRATLRKSWIRYQAAGISGLAEASRAPRSSPARKVFAPEAALIRDLRGQGLGLARIRAALLSGHGLDVSVPTIRKVLGSGDRADADRPAAPATVAPPVASLFTARLPEDEITRELAARIAGGGFRPGDRLTEESLCQMFGAGRTRIRQALRALAVIGLVTIERNRGAVVASPSPRAVADAYDARRVVEAGIVRRLARDHDADDIAALKRHLRRQQEAEARGEKVALVHMLTDFHLLLASLVGNPYLRGFVETLASTTSLAVLVYDQSAAPSCAVAEHTELVHLLEQGDAEGAAALMTGHLSHNQQRLDAQQAFAPADGDAARPGADAENTERPRAGRGDQRAAR